MKPLLAWLAAFSLASVAAAHETASPDGRVIAAVSIDNGRPSYTLRLGENVLIEPSPLGLVTSWGDFTDSVELAVGEDNRAVDIAYEMPCGKHARVNRSMRESVYTLTDADGHKLRLVVRVGDDGLAFRYELPDAAVKKVVVYREATTFDLPRQATGFLHPMAEAKTGWSRTQPSYEELYSIDRPVGEPSTLGHGWCFPALFRVGDAGWVLLSETGLADGYCGGKLAHESPGGAYRLAFPQPEEHTTEAPVEPTLASGGATPWRTVVVGETLAPIVESTMATDLVEPVLDAESFQPGRAAWSWLPLKDAATVASVQRDFVAMAARLGWEYVLIDCLWDQQIGREEIAKIVAEAREQGVGVLLWYNSNGQWNDAPFTPLDRMHTADARAEEMAWMKKIGVRGIKVDFFGGDKQAVFQLYDAILRDAAEHDLAVNFHGTTLPRGWSRMYPSFATDEAVRGMEFCTFEQPNADAQPTHCTVLPFTRNAVAPMDFTPLMVSERLGPGGDNGPRRRTRLSYEMALPVLFFSPITHFGVKPADLDVLPDVAIEYLRSIPTVWNETRHLAGYPGRFAVLARRAGGAWWVAGVNGTDEPITVELPDDLAAILEWRSVDDAGFNEVTEGDGPTDGSLILPAKGGVVMWSAGSGAR